MIPRRGDHNFTPMRRTFLALIALFSLVGCGTVRVAGTPLTAAMRFPFPDSLVIPTDSATAPQMVPCTSRACAPKYPELLRNQGVQGDLVIVLVVDVRGRVEMPSASFIKDTPHPAFRRELCTFLLDARFVHPQGVQPRRALVAVPFSFTIGRRDWILSVKDVEDWLTQTPRPLVIERLHSLNHCV